FTSFLSCSMEEERDAVPQRLEGYEPRVECSPAVRGELVRSLRGARKVGAPLGPDEAVLLECPERPVHVSDVDALVDEKCRKSLEELVSMSRAIRQESEKRRLTEPLDPRPHLPRPVVEPTAAPGTHAGSASHISIICNL